MEVYKEIKKVNTKDEFTRFIDFLINDYSSNLDEWENRNIEDFLNSMKSWVEDMEGYYLNNNLPVPKDIDWNFLASVFYAGKIYE